jgi:hypothetical protein
LRHYSSKGLVPEAEAVPFHRDRNLSAPQRVLEGAMFGTAYFIPTIYPEHPDQILGCERR